MSFHTEKRARQLLDFSGFNLPRGTPTDIDFGFELGGDELVLGEYKGPNGSFHRGQRLFLTRLICAAQRGGMDCLAILCRHDTQAHERVNAAECIVEEFLLGAQHWRGWQKPDRRRTADEFINAWLKWSRQQKTPPW